MNTQEKIIPADQVQALIIDDNAHENPYLDPAYAKALEKDIAEKGQIDPVFMFNGMIVDGRNRINAIITLKLDLKVLELNDCTYDEAVEYARSKNDHRRHMDTSQLAMKAAYEILKSRVTEDGTKKPRPQWLQLKNQRDIVAKKISVPTVEIAISIVKQYPEYAQQIFEGKYTLQQVSKLLELKKAKLTSVERELKDLQPELDKDPFFYPNGEIKPKSLVYQDKTVSYLGAEYSEEVATRYIHYTKELTIEEIALKLVELEELLEEQKNSRN
jgi:hypothetical protein